MTAVRNTVILGPSRMMGNYHVRFLEEGNPVRGCPYSTKPEMGPKGPNQEFNPEFDSMNTIC